MDQCPVCGHEGTVEEVAHHLLDRHRAIRIFESPIVMGNMPLWMDHWGSTASERIWCWCGQRFPDAMCDDRTATRTLWIKHLRAHGGVVGHYLEHALGLGSSQEADS